MAPPIIENEKQPYSEKWLALHKQRQKAAEQPYRAQNPLPELQSDSNPNGMNKSGYNYMMQTGANAALRYLRDIGVADAGKDGKVPVRNGVPALFIVKDGKVSTLEENGIESLTVEEKNSRIVGNPKFAEAAYRGEIFAYPAGERYPVQIRLTQRGSSTTDIQITQSTPLKPGLQKIELTEMTAEPQLTREPKWYHRLFPFWGNNRKICQDYDKSVADREKWRKEMPKRLEEAEKNKPEAFRAAQAIEERFGAARTQEALLEERKFAFGLYDADRKEDSAKKALAAGNQAEKARRGAEIAMNVYAPHPVFREKWEKTDIKEGLYSREDFDRLTNSTLDLNTVQLGGRPVDEQTYAKLAIFASLQPDIAEKAQREAVMDPTQMLDTLRAKGYSEEMAKEVLLTSVGQAYTTDVLHTEDRMHHYFNSAMNGSKEKTDAALKEYAAGRKEKLAEILSRAVQFAGDAAGTHDSMYNGGDAGIHNMIIMAGETLDLLQDDKELMQLAREKYEARDKMYCEELNKQVKPYAPEKKAPLKPRTFRENLEKIRNFKAFHEIEQRGMDAVAKLEKANEEDRVMDTAEKRECIRDILKCRIFAGIYRQEIRERGYINEDKVSSSGLNAGRVALQNYYQALQDEANAANGELVNEIAVSSGGGSSLPVGAPSIIKSGLDARFTEVPPVLRMVNDPVQVRTIEDGVEKVMEQDKLETLDTEDLAEILRVGFKTKDLYTGEKLILRTAELAEIEKGNREKTKQLDREKASAENAAASNNSGISV